MIQKGLKPIAQQMADIPWSIANWATATKFSKSVTESRNSAEVDNKVACKYSIK